MVIIMGHFQWTKELSVHIEEIDNQHKEFFSIINELNESIKTEKKEDDILGTILSQLIEYAIIHFTTEERLMKKYGYYDLANHKKEHDGFKKHILELKNKFNTDQSVSAATVAKFSKEWLTKHIKMTDMKYASFLEDKDITLS